jgi:hypothetical protein
MARRKETTIERIYREVTGNKMPAAVKRVLLPKRKVKRHQCSVPWSNWECQATGGWKHLEDGGRVKFTYQDLPGEVAFITAQVEGNKVLYSIRITQRQEPDQSWMKLPLVSRVTFQKK